MDRMTKNYLIVDVAHSVHGRIRRLHIPHYVLHVVFCLAVFGAIMGIGFVSSYARLLWKVTEFNELRTEKEALQKKFGELQRTVEERNTQLASLGELAGEVSIAFGIRRPFTERTEMQGEGGLEPSLYGSFVDQYDFLQQVQLSPQGSNSLWYWLENTTPSLWPVQGALTSSFGRRLDPFIGQGAFHPGVDMQATHGLPVVAAADGVVEESGWAGLYGKMVVLSHGRNGLATHYAHLSSIFVRPGQVVRRGEVIGRVGQTGKATAPHLHYEVRYRGTPVNPYRYLKNTTAQPVTLVQAD
jgi:murein DD-endopeptidase MepM/ murein hydrolase activator NlpD